MIGSAKAGFDVSITGLGCKVPDRVVTNDELSQHVDTSDEWIIERTGIRERRIAAPEEALSDLALPAARARSSSKQPLSRAFSGSSWARTAAAARASGCPAAAHARSRTQSGS